jgi:hypothetical protein
MKVNPNAALNRQLGEHFVVVTYFSSTGNRIPVHRDKNVRQAATFSQPFGVLTLNRFINKSREPGAIPEVYNLEQVDT